MKPKQSGATIVEFMLVLLLFLMFTFGILDFARMLFTWNAANEATRAGARYAVVCDPTGGEADVLATMQGVLPDISTISVVWTPPSCDPTTCIGVTVSITGLNFQWIAPMPGSASKLIPMPQFSTFLTREVMRQDPNSNAICS
ncbi:TadE/TadG family type IV pilus assembly protein [Caenimonas soli]|uniref:TadE/TadG family type IV pilus assembly protein n=1 Tax=Caenimonas soli TaxID=2735555 RepID=UPI001555B588|nr:TadE/TadG family type IV pilus assembly protein [Caenimonas soli]NPC55467.1 pilus assembly protein [Caenimonas soli]